MDLGKGVKAFEGAVVVTGEGCGVRGLSGRQLLASSALLPPSTLMTIFGDWPW